MGAKFGRYLDFIATPAITLILLVGHVLCFGITLTGAALFLLGFVAWTLFEYWLHRLAHVLPCLQADHFHHHEHPRDPSGPSSLLTSLVYAGAAWAGIGSLWGVGLAGFLVGYTAFLFIHYAVHHFTIAPGEGLYFHKLRHSAHHRWGNFYGVITDFWDRVHNTTW